MQSRLKLIGILVVLVLIALVPLVLARYVFNHSASLHIRKRNHGQLIKPVSVAQINVYSKQSHQQAISNWSGHWLLVYSSVNHCCDKSCLQVMHRLHQVRIALHNGIERTRVVLLLPKRCPLPKLEKSNHVWRLSHQQALIWQQKLPGRKPAVLIIDPNSLAMLAYKAQIKSRSVYEDMRILLHTSQIG